MRVIIDRFEGDYAVCQDENKKIINIERGRLPHDACEGCVLLIHNDRIEVDYVETEKRKEKIKKLMDLIWD
ncbi:MAG: DUF3006 domain-containing protein [Clostridiales bacterium]|jgi:hypothetical protein|nr:DUF3006 domain-containing protein [Clostridiales bacterium]